MSQFAEIARRGTSRAVQSGRLRGGGIKFGSNHRQALASGSRVLQHLATTNGNCSADPQCRSVWEVLNVAYQGSEADSRTALTQLQTLLCNLTASDSTVAADQPVQDYRKYLHLLLDH